MSNYLKRFDTHSQYESYTADTTNFITPNISVCKDAPTNVHYNPLTCDGGGVYDIIDTPTYPSTINGNATSFNITVNYIKTACTEAVIEGTDTVTVVCGTNPSTLSSRTVTGTVDYHNNEIEYSVTQTKSNLTITAIFNITDISDPTQISYKDSNYDGTSGFSAIEVDGVILPSVVSVYTFDTPGEHTIKYFLKNGYLATRAFYNCYSLTNIEIPSGVTSIRDMDFSNCSGLTSIVIPDSVTTIRQSAFTSCYSLTSVTIPDSVTTIGDYAFQSCSALTSIVIPDSVTSIGNDVFKGCKGLTSCTIGSGVTSIGGSAFSGCTSLTSIVIPDSVTTIGNYAFRICTGLTSCTIGSGVTSIGVGTFNGCTNLTSIAIDSNNVTYDSRDNCNAIIETSTNTLILGCANTFIPNTVTSIGGGAFGGCNGLTSITIPNSVTSIGGGAFGNCVNLTTCEIYSIITGSYAFRGCTSLTNVTIGSGVTTISYSSFSDCSGLTSIDIPDNVTSIGDYAFSYCTSLTSCTIGSGVTSIGGEAFRHCTKLNTITSNATTAPTIYSDSFEDIKTDGVLYVPYDSSGYDSWMATGATYLGYYNWFKIELLETRVVAKFNVTSTSEPTPIGYDRFISGFSEIEIDGVVLPSVVSAYTFSTTGEHTVKYTLTDPTTIGSIAFSGCSSLTSIDIPDSVTSIGSSAFRNCSGLTSVDVPDSVTSIAQFAFQGCSSLTSIDIPDSVTSIGTYAFNKCSSLTSIDIPSGVTSIDNYTFYQCTGLTSCTIGSGVTSIGVGDFEGCSHLTSVVIPSGVTSIGTNAFYNCSSLTSIVCNATTAPTISNTTFRNVKTGGTLTVPIGNSGYNTWMQNANYYLGLYNWTKVEQ